MTETTPTPSAAPIPEATTVPEVQASGLPQSPTTMTPTRIDIEEKVIDMLRTVYDPEIPVNIYELGLIYRIELSDDCTQLDVDMTLTAPNCPAADFIMEDVRQKLCTITELTTVNVNLVFEPEWTKDMMSEEAQLELGLI